MKIKEFAPAKINLCLHVTGQRADGFHELDSLVAFADVGDWITVEPAPQMELRITGPGAADLPTDHRNLVSQAAALFPDHCTTLITLDKYLPQAAGVGGGSADAAATLRAMARLWSVPMPGLAAQTALGADVPVCVQGGVVRMQGIGEKIGIGPKFPTVAIVLVNPRVPTATPPVFRALKIKDNPGLSDPAPEFKSVADLVEWLSYQRNDLEAPAITLHGEVGDVLDALARTNPMFAQMSGSGATCFGIYETKVQADEMANHIREAHPDWWVRAANIIGS